MPSPASAMYGASLVPYPVYPVSVGVNVLPDADNQQSGPVQGRRQNDCCFNCHRPGYYKAECPERQHKTQAATTSKSDTRTYLHILVGGHEDTCLLDTKCNHSMPRRLVPNTPLTSTNIYIYAANGTPIPVMGSVNLRFEVAGAPVCCNFLVSDAVHEPMHGIDWLEENNCHWAFVHHHHHRQPWAQCPLVSDAILTIAAHRCLSKAAWLNSCRVVPHHCSMSSDHSR